MSPKEDLKDIKPIVYVLVIIFAIASWVEIIGVWVELPLMVNVLPEGWKLPAYLAIIVQSANIGPVAYTIIKRCSSNKVMEWPFVCVIISVDAVCCLFLVFFWDQTTYIGGELHSTGLLTLCALLALADCTSSVVFLPYMAIYKPHYMTAYYMGVGLGGLLPGMMGLAQGTSQEPKCVNTSMITTASNVTYFSIVPEYPAPNFSAEIFWWILLTIVCLSGIAFSVVHWLPYCKTERVSGSLSYDMTMPSTEMGEIKLTSVCTDVEHKSVEVCAVKTQSESKKENTYNDMKQNPGLPANQKANNQNKRQTGFLLAMVGLNSFFLYGILPSTQSYSCLPYGNFAYTLSISLSNCANPLASLVALLAPRPGLAGIGMCGGLGTLLSAYQIFLAVVSPYPPLQNETAGVVLVVLTKVLLEAFLSYVNVSAAILLRETGGNSALLWCGGVNQTGAFIGAMIGFICVNVASVFTSGTPCPM